MDRKNVWHMNMFDECFPRKARIRPCKRSICTASSHTERAARVWRSHVKPPLKEEQQRGGKSGERRPKKRLRVRGSVRLATPLKQAMLRARDA